MTIGSTCASVPLCSPPRGPAAGFAVRAWSADRFRAAKRGASDTGPRALRTAVVTPNRFLGLGRARSPHPQSFKRRLFSTSKLRASKLRASKLRASKLRASKRGAPNPWRLRGKQRCTLQGELETKKPAAALREPWKTAASAQRPSRRAVPQRGLSEPRRAAAPQLVRPGRLPRRWIHCVRGRLQRDRERRG